MEKGETRFLVKIDLKGVVKKKTGLVVVKNIRDLLEDVSGGLVMIKFVTEDIFIFSPVDLLSIDVSPIKRGSPPIQRHDKRRGKRTPKKVVKTIPNQEPAKKRGPGRPRKNAVPAPLTEKKRGRGRPRKIIND